jgi:arylamine N-acetyltransferase
VLAIGQADAKTAWCTSGENFDCNEGEHGCFDLQTELRTVYRFLRWKIRYHETYTPFASFHSHHWLIHYFSQRNKKNLAPNKRTNFYLQNEENSKMEDHLHIHQIQAKQ